MNYGLRDKILELRAKEYDYDRIALALDCAKSTVSYHCSGITKQTAARRRNRVRPIQSVRIKKLAGGKCIICGYDKCMSALEFHHLHPDEKDASVTKLIGAFGFKRAYEESKKCVLLCSNCHREVHAGITNVPS